MLPPILSDMMASAPSGVEVTYTSEVNIGNVPPVQGKKLMRLLHRIEARMVAATSRSAVGERIDVREVCHGAAIRFKEFILIVETTCPEPGGPTAGPITCKIIMKQDVVLNVESPLSKFFFFFQVLVLQSLLSMGKPEILGREQIEGHSAVVAALDLQAIWDAPEEDDKTIENMLKDSVERSEEPEERDVMQLPAIYVHNKGAVN